MNETEFQKKKEEMEKALPQMRKDVNDFKRLLKLAKESPFAAANSDFLERIELEWERRAGETKLLETILPIIDKADREKKQ